MRRSEAAVALIRRDLEGHTLWLAQWNPKWRAYHFVSGHRRPDETFRECLVREVAEELALREEVDYHAAPGPVVHLEYSAWSESANAETWYVMELFGVELTEEAWHKIDAESENSWLSGTEICSGSAHDGMPVSSTMKRLLEAMTSEKKA
jgi:8-oxo-dGTP pyrophosphatase MutT (NUDIX family)